MLAAVLGKMGRRRELSFEEYVEPVIHWLDSGCPPYTQVRPVSWGLVLPSVLACVAVIAGFAVVDLHGHFVPNTVVSHVVTDRAI